MPDAGRPTAHHDEREDHDGHEEDFSIPPFADFVSFEVFVMVFVTVCQS
jgi:hypothetical protein